MTTARGEHYNSMQRATTKPTILEARLEVLVRNGLAWLAEWILCFIKIGLFVLSIPRRILPTILHVAAFTTILPALLAISVGAGITVVNLIPTGWHTDLWMQYGEQPTPFARTSLPPLTPGQPYDISLSLQVPFTPENLALGNFMTKLILTDAKNTTVATANRPSLVLRRQAYWIPLLMGSPQVEIINVPLVENWSPSSQPGNLLGHGVAVARGASHQGFHAFIAVGRSDAWKSLGSGQGKELSIVRATLHGHVKLSGLRGFFARHKLLLFMLTTAIFFAASTGAAIVFYLLLAPSLSADDDIAAGGIPSIQEQGTQTTPRTGFKEEDTEPPSTSETEYSWTSGGPGRRIKAESDDDDSSTDT
ncbi:adipose-regulatory protein, putative [Rhizoctonia solani AG-3 Rhs1AP]|uniref:Adipose-regulatory protein, putative n=1 Tax=Rhizoctonia solani AG-3 Rhs1AP TaxID=1086054 RepID=X8IVV4_9AGAM|nr:adipose-regulatory protein, putative [Rhizoctonia solani AG-3 Rhs1AP]